ncbi:uncharacterized protein CC84DRAFT_649061 [Paraphaeosphaeria sporulosa]|uniref:Uncharacterized protein n=1 Tax=Paraphaeosphaeria sporulosa TaxID=1460663 RepID=A0A177CKC5_9PLEO|nr:uncharacterized protein CC84DRAFT_649061 [Paraphaeosphaeria sporulosa]OAG07247.1 hypothetical protein CC84DRAFT_649061 [Paraphaeosphaeria sporulosa]
MSISRCNHRSPRMPLSCDSSDFVASQPLAAPLIVRPLLQSSLPDPASRAVLLMNYQMDCGKMQAILHLTRYSRSVKSKSHSATAAAPLRCSNHSCYPGHIHISHPKHSLPLIALRKIIDKPSGTWSFATGASTISDRKRSDQTCSRGEMHTRRTWSERYDVKGQFQTHDVQSRLACAMRTELPAGRRHA